MKPNLCAHRGLVALAVVAASVASLYAQTQLPPKAGPTPALDATPPGGMPVGTFPGITEAQMFYYQQALNHDFQMVDLAVTTARAELARASLAEPRNDPGIAAAVNKLVAAELAAANADRLNVNRMIKADRDMADVRRTRDRGVINNRLGGATRAF